MTKTDKSFPEKIYLAIENEDEDGFVYYNAAKNIDDFNYEGDEAKVLGIYTLINVIGTRRKIEIVDEKAEER